MERQRRVDEINQLIVAAEVSVAKEQLHLEQLKARGLDTQGTAVRLRVFEDSLEALYSSKSVLLETLEHS